MTAGGFNCRGYHTVDDSRWFDTGKLGGEALSCRGAVMSMLEIVCWEAA
jgi:hypothetical protein